MGDVGGWLKVVHLLAVFSWMAGLFYLPRLMVYHADAAVGSAVSEQFKVMERRLLAAIMRPAMVASWVFGWGLAWQAGWLAGGSWWLWVKVALVVAMTAVHGRCEKHVREFSCDLRLHSNRYYRVLNEVPTVLLILIVIVVVLKPI